MKLAHIVLVHKNPAQVERLIKSLQHPGSWFFIHVDRKTDITAFEDLKKYPTVHFITDRVNVNWGGYSQVKAMANSMKQAIDSGIKFDFINALSGQDYPLRPISQFFDYLDANQNKCFIEFCLPGHPWFDDARPKLTKYHFTDFPMKGKYVLQKIWNTVFTKKYLPKDLILVGRYPYFTIDLESARYLVNRFEKPDSIIRFFKYTWGSDEMIFHTLLFNSPHRDKIVNNNLRYMVWKEGESRPETFCLSDSILLKRSGAFFARKFDMENDGTVMDYIDQNFLKRTPDNKAGFDSFLALPIRNSLTYVNGWLF